MPRSNFCAACAVLIETNMQRDRRLREMPFLSITRKMRSSGGRHLKPHNDTSGVNDNCVRHGILPLKVTAVMFAFSGRQWPSFIHILGRVSDRFRFFLFLTGQKPGFRRNFDAYFGARRIGWSVCRSVGRATHEPLTLEIASARRVRVANAMGAEMEPERVESSRLWWWTRRSHFGRSLYYLRQRPPRSHCRTLCPSGQWL